MHVGPRKRGRFERFREFAGNDLCVRKISCKVLIEAGLVGRMDIEQPTLTRAAGRPSSVNREICSLPNSAISRSLSMGISKLIGVYRCPSRAIQKEHENS